jgi:RNA polymerase sigma-70 factor (ECF subfamily)
VPASDFEQLVEHFYMPLYRFALSLTRDPCDAADLTQQTFLLWASKGHQLREQSKVKAWLFTSLYREFLRCEKQRSRESSSEDQLPEVECLPVAANSVDGDAVVRALLDLEEIYRAPLSLFYLQEHSYKEIAETLNLPVGTVMSRISRGKARLRQKVAADAHQNIAKREMARRKKKQKEIPPGIAAVETMGCRILYFRGYPVTLICFCHGQTVAHLLIVDRAALPGLKPGNQPVVTSQGDWTTATWVDQHYACMIAVHDKPAAARQYLPHS